MRYRIVSYEQHHVSEMKAFNQRLQASVEGRKLIPFSETPESSWLPRSEGKRLFDELFVAVDEEGAVRGGYILKHQSFQINGRLVDLGFCRYPLSEGIVDPRYAIVGALLFRDAIRRQPLLYAVGFGNLNDPYGKSVRAMGWKIYPISFFFMILRTKKFLRNIEFLRTSTLRRGILDLLAFSRILGPLVGATHRGLALPSMFAQSMQCEIVTEFGAWANEVWLSACGSYSLAAVRDSITLNAEYPTNKPFYRLRFSHRGEVVGWAVLLATQMSGHKQFGSMYVGSIVDCLALPGKEMGVIRGSTSYLRSLGVDLIVTNQSHASWKKALKRTGFLRGPSNYFLGISGGLEVELGPFARNLPSMHLNRGDGSGPVHL